MTRALRLLGALLVLLVAVLAGWRVVATRIADTLAATAPHRALAWDRRDPVALLALAQQQLEAKQPAAAAATARTLLATDPLQAQALVLLGRVAEAQKDSADAKKMYALALRRAPRDQHARAWMIGTQLREGDYHAALENIDVLLRIAPPRADVLIPIMGQLAEKPAFASALARALAAKPEWRWRMLDELLKSASYTALDEVYGQLQSDGGLSDAEADQWFRRLTKAGLWDEAYSRWAGRLNLKPGTPLPAVYNGGFENVASGVGFDWVMQGEPGVQIERAPIGGAGGNYAAQVTFLGRRAQDINFYQTVLLSPGTYRLSFRAQASNLRSDKGLEWAIRCVAGGDPIAVSSRLEGSFDWKSVHTDFVVPAENCPAQVLWLRNPGADGAGKLVSGVLWFDNFAITELPAAAVSSSQRQE